MKKHQHVNCDFCEFLGSVMDLDLYVCRMRKEKTFIARYGSDRNEYFSRHWSDLVNSEEPLTASYRMLKAVAEMWMESQKKECFMCRRDISEGHFCSTECGSNFGHGAILFHPFPP